MHKPILTTFHPPTPVKYKLQQASRDFELRASSQCQKQLLYITIISPSLGWQSKGAKTIRGVDFMFICEVLVEYAKHIRQHTKPLLPETQVGSPPPSTSILLMSRSDTLTQTCLICETEPFDHSPRGNEELCPCSVLLFTLLCMAERGRRSPVFPSLPLTLVFHFHASLPSLETDQLRHLALIKNPSPTSKQMISRHLPNFTTGNIFPPASIFLISHSFF